MFRSLVTLSCIIVSLTSGARILMISTQIRSHIYEQLSIGEELVARGHDVYVAIGSRYPDLDSIRSAGIEPVTFHVPDDEFYYASEGCERFLAGFIFNKSETLMDHPKRTAERLGQDCARAMQDRSFLTRLRELNLDLAIAEPFLWNPCPLLLPRALGIPFVSMTTFYMPWLIRASAMPSFYPRYMLRQDDGKQIPFWTRFANFLVFVAIELDLPFRAFQDTILLKIHAPELGSWYELVRESELFFFEHDHHLGDPFPSFPNHISVAGISAKPAKPLPRDLENLIGRSKDGIIAVGFGSTAYYFPDEVVDKFLRTVSELGNYAIFAKFFVPNHLIVPKNAIVFHSFPQNDILGHHRTKLFITHCGNNGQHEALYHGVQMIGFPLFAEQSQNCHRAKVKGIGLTMNIHNFTSEELFDNVQEVLKTPKYASNIRRASEIFRNQPMSPRERAVFWIEHVIEYGGKHLRSSATDLPLYQFLMLDVIGFLLFVVFLICFLLRFLFLRLYRSYFPPRQSSVEPKLQ